MFAVLASLLIAVAGPENLSPPMGAPAQPYDVAGPSSAIVRDGSGFLLAFEAQSAASPRTRIFVTRLDALGRMTGDLREMPASSEMADAVLPSIAAAPDGHYVGQLESNIGIVWHVTPASTTALARLAGPSFVRGGDGKLFAVASDRVFEYALDGRFAGITLAPSSDDAVVVGGKAVLVGHVNRPAGITCGLIECPPSPPSRPAYDVFAGDTRITYEFNSSNGVGAATDGATILAAFFAGDQTAGGDVQFARFDATTLALREDPRRLGSFDPDPLRQALRPAVAFDGRRWLVVWQTRHSDGSHAVRAAAVDADGNVAEVVIPHLGDETLPSVVAGERGRFLLSYEIRRDGQWHLATRMIYFDLGRRPAAGR